MRQEALEQGLNEIVRRHEILRTTFSHTQEQLTQVIAPHLPLTLSVRDLQHIPAEEWEAEAQRVAQQEADLPFDLAQGPLIRTLLLRFTEQRQVLILVAHQIIFDAWSTGVFLQELAALYQAHASDQPSPLPALPRQYADFALCQQEWVQEDTLAPHLAYWKHFLGQAPAALELSINPSHARAMTNRGGVHPFVLSRELMHALAALSQQKEVPLSASLLAGFAALLFEDLVERMHQMVTTTLTHAEVPFEYVMQELHPERHAGQNALFQVLFALEPAPPALPSGWSLLPVHIEIQSARSDLSLIMTEYPEGLHGSLEYRTDLFDAATIKRMVGHWLTLLEAAVAHPTNPLATLPILPERERHQMLVEWNATQAPYQEDTPLHHLIEEQVEQTLDAVAVSFAGHHLTYQALNEQANRLAHHL